MSTIIQVTNISKQYRLGQVGTGTISHDLNRWWYRIRGKDDPFLKIGEENDRSKKGSSDYAWALRDINFEVQQGEVLGIIGRNGAGKSTLLKILSRTTAPTTGQIKIKGRVASLLEVGTGFHPEMTGRENIFLNGAILGMTRSEIKSKFDEIVDFSGVERYIDTPVKRYSSGMYVRLAFAVAAHLEPEILIVDEVLAVGDAEFQKKCLGKMKDVSVNEGRTVLFVSHNMTAIRDLCNQGILLTNGTSKFYNDCQNAITDYIGLKQIQDNFNADINSIGIDEIYITNINALRIKDISGCEEVVINFVFKSIFEGYDLGFTVFDDNNNAIVSAISSDSSHSQIHESKMSIKIPANLFKKGIFRIELVFNGKNLESAFTFTKNIPDSKFIALGYSSKAPLVSTKWQ